MNLQLNGVVFGAGAWSPVPSSFGPVNGSLTLSTLFPRKNYQGHFPIKIPGYALNWLASTSTVTGSGTGDYTAFTETLSNTPNPSTMNQVGLPSDAAVATKVTRTSDGASITLLANTQSYV